MEKVNYTKMVKELKQELDTLHRNVKLVPNPKYMVDTNQRELMWSKEDSEKYDILVSMITSLGELMGKKYLNISF